MTRTINRRRNVIAAIMMLLLMLVVAACGGDDEDSNGEDSGENGNSNPNQIAFLSENEDGDHILVVVDADGDNRRVVAESVLSNPTIASSWSWSPDGGQLMYRTRLVDDDQEVLYVVDADGGNRRSIAAEQRVFGAAWSPDGSLIAFTSDASDSPPLLNIIDVDGSNRRSVEAIADFVVWSPDSSQIAYLDTADLEDIYVVDSEGQNARNVTETEVPEFQLEWSPDGREISYISGGALMGMDANGQNLHTIADEVARYLWSPEGDQIVFYNINYDLFIVDADGSNQRELDSRYHLQIDDFGWLPDGEQIVVSGGLYSVVDVETGDSQPIDFAGDFSPYSMFSLSPDGSQLVIIGSEDEGETSGLYVMDVDGSNIQRLADADTGMSNPVWRPR